MKVKIDEAVDVENEVKKNLKILSDSLPKLTKEFNKRFGTNTKMYQCGRDGMRVTIESDFFYS